MSEESVLILRGNKNAQVIMCMAEMFHVPIKTATDIFYRSQTAAMIEDHIADLHCRSNKYLASLIWDEYKESIENNIE